MNDPYQVLGVAPGATDVQVKKAYKRAAKQALKLSQEQQASYMRDLDAAYDQIMNERRGNGSYTNTYTGASDPYQTNSYSDAPYSQPYGYADATSFADVRQLVMNGRYDDANMILDGVPAPGRNAEWHFLKGQVLYNRGWLEDASREFETAYRMEPGNNEYRNTYESIFTKRSGGYRARPERRGCSTCDICSGLICADCCCESMGGDLIPCC